MSVRNLRKETIIVDCQVFQTIALHRGMGKYSMNLLEAVLPKMAESGAEIVLVFNKNRVLETEAKKQIEAIRSGAELVFLDLKTPETSGYPESIKSNKTSLESYILKSCKGRRSSFMILALFLGHAVASVFPSNAYKIVLFYDLIPLLYFRRYAPYVNFDEYLIHYRVVFDADMVLTISRTVADDLIIYLGLPESVILNINGAPVDRSNIAPVVHESLEGKKFILMPTGDEIRKNNNRAVEAFEKFNRQNNNEYVLVLTSFFNLPTVTALKQLSDNLIFTGNIKEEELQWLYNHAGLLLFATEYEGLGLPILEAMTVKKPIVCSDIPVFREISEDAMYYFDPLDVADIARTMEIALKDVKFEDKSKLYGAILDKYTWEVTANTFFKAFCAKKLIKSLKKKKLAIVAPDPSGYSAIGKVVAESHSAMAEHFDIDYYYDKGSYHKELRIDYLSWVANSYDIDDLNAKVYAAYDAVVYHIGNSDYHLRSIKKALTLPGYIILHDVFLDGAFEMLEAEGHLSPDRVGIERKLNSFTKSETSSFITSLTAAQSGVFCHSKYARDAIRSIESEINVEQVNLPVSEPVIQRNLFMDKQSVTKVCFAGIIHEAKGMNVIKKLSLQLSQNDIHITVFGYDLGNQQAVNELKALRNVELVQNPTDFEFQTLLAQQHLLVNYRNIYRGETSLTVLEAMRYGVIPIVRKIGWYEELSTDSVVILEFPDEIYDHIIKLHNDSNLLSTMSLNARAYIAEYHNHIGYAEIINQSIIRTESAGSKNAEFVELVKSNASKKQIADRLY